MYNHLMDFSAKKCVACEGGIPPLRPQKCEEYLQSLNSPWMIQGGNQSIKKEFQFKDFKQAVRFVNQVADIAEAEGHHPDIHVFYNKVLIELTTHAIGGLSENDFILAAKIEKLESR